MPYPIPGNSIMELQYRYKMNGQQCINVFHYLGAYSFADGRAAATEMLNDFINRVAGIIQARQTSQVTDCRSRAQWVYPTRYAHIELAHPDPEGGQAPPTLSIGTSIVLKRMSDLASRSSRGRVFIGGGPVADAVVGELTVGALGTWNDLVSPVLLVELDTLASPGAGKPIIWSYTDPDNRDYVVTTAADRALRYQRRREVGRGK